MKFAAMMLALLTALAAFGGDTSLLRPPKGHRVAIVTFEDLQCPDCARAEPVLKDAIEETKVPLVRHDFPLPQHNWSYDAHIIARYLDTKSAKLGEEYRHWVFMNQNSISKNNLRGMSDRFAEEHKVQIPMVVDPKGIFAKQVKADFELGQKVGVGHTPTIYVVSDTTRGQPFVEVVDRMQLVQMIKDTKAQVAKEKPAAKKSAGRKSAKK